MQGLLEQAVKARYPGSAFNGRARGFLRSGPDTDLRADLEATECVMRPEDTEAYGSLPQSRCVVG